MAPAQGQGLMAKMRPQTGADRYFDHQKRLRYRKGVARTTSGRSSTGSDVMANLEPTRPDPTRVEQRPSAFWLWLKRRRRDERCVAFEAGERCPWKAKVTVTFPSTTAPGELHLCAWHAGCLQRTETVLRAIEAGRVPG